MSRIFHDTALPFRLGQIDALQRIFLGNPTLYPTEMHHWLALRQLSRAWVQYRIDRAINAGEALIGAECTSERNAFLGLLEEALPSPDLPLAQAIRTIRRIAIRPMKSEANHTLQLIEEGTPVLTDVLEALANPRLPSETLARLLALVKQFGHSDGLGDDPLSATARTPCWAINLAAAAGHSGFRLSETLLPCPGLVQRRLFRADLEPERQRDEARDIVLEALHETLCDIARLPRAAEIFRREFPDVQRNSRLFPAWMTLFALGGLTAAQMARAIGVTKAGTAKLLHSLEQQQMAHGKGIFQPFVCTINIPVAFPTRVNAATDETPEINEDAVGNLVPAD